MQCILLRSTVNKGDGYSKLFRTRGYESKNRTSILYFCIENLQIAVWRRTPCVKPYMAETLYAADGGVYVLVVRAVNKSLAMGEKL